MPSTDSLLFPDTNLGPDFSIELKLYSSDAGFVAGVDEVGRGPLAGPVVTAAVVLDPENIPAGLNDSKKLTHAKRESLFVEILSTSQVAWASMPAHIIDDINIREAALLAMTRAVVALPIECDHVLVDGRDVPAGIKHIGKALVKGDSRSLSIAAASIIAKVMRDRMMTMAHQFYPEYGFDRHKGYGSKFHRDAISTHGPCPLHRRSFSPIKDMAESTN